jgi:hypothetical protein
VLGRKVYESEDNKLLASLGVLNRNYEIRNDTIFTGSLLYVTRKKQLLLAHSIMAITATFLQLGSER